MYTSVFGVRTKDFVGCRLAAKNRFFGWPKSRLRSRVSLIGSEVRDEDPALDCTNDVSTRGEMTHRGLGHFEILWTALRGKESENQQRS